MTSFERSPHYRHKPLRESDFTIRLIDVLPVSAPNQVIQCRVKDDVSTLEHTQPQYKALSYECGSDTIPRHTILVNDRPFRIGQNLLDFLTNLLQRYPEGISSLWIDALCIDQGNIKEKNHQVQQMKTVFKNASEVLLWLGASDDESDLVFDCIEDAKTAGVPASSQKPELTWSELGKTHNIWKDTVLLPDRNFEAIEAVVPFCQRTYFTRTWIIQEIVLAQRATLICGRKQLDWATWVQVLDHWVNPAAHPDRHLRHRIKESHAWTVCQEWWRHKNVSAGTRSLGELAVQFAGFNCSIVHDKVYALTGLITTGQVFTVDYDCTVTDLCLFLLGHFPPRFGPAELRVLLQGLSLSLSTKTFESLLEKTPPLGVFSGPIDVPQCYWVNVIRLARRVGRKIRGPKTYAGLHLRCDCDSCKAAFDTRPPWSVSPEAMKHIRDFTLCQGGFGVDPGSVVEDEMILVYHRYVYADTWIEVTEAGSKEDSVQEAEPELAEPLSRSVRLAFHDPFFAGKTEPEFDTERAMTEKIPMRSMLNFMKHWTALVAFSKGTLFHLPFKVQDSTTVEEALEQYRRQRPATKKEIGKVAVPRGSPVELEG